MTARIDRVWPNPADNLTDDDLVEGLGAGVRLNFVESVDGSATHDGLSGALGGPADKRQFELLRRVADVVLVGAGTIRDEGYGGLRVRDSSARWRRDHGMPEHPPLAIVSRELDLDPGAPVFTSAPVRPLVVTSRRAPRIDRFEGVADVIEAGEHVVDLAEALHALGERGLSRVLCEGGPSLFSALLAADLVDELFVTIAPRLEGGDGPRIAHGETAAVRMMRLDQVLRSGDTLLLRYARPAG